MSPRKLIAGNWKMHMGPGDAGPLAQALKKHVLDVFVADVTVAPPFVSLPEVVAALRHTGIQVAAQNLHWQPQGAYTGEVSAEMLVAIGCTQVIIGHSERRQYFAETDATVNKKLHAALRAGLGPIVCVGETLAEREAGQQEAVVERQLEGGLAGIDADDLARLVIAYEPVWAIGTGRTASHEQAQAMHSTIRQWLRAHFSGGAASGLRILYGGSVKASNAALLLAQPDIDGALVGGAALDPVEFSRIVVAAG
ncbi:MAG: triose-phosphate isomerase [Pseudomonadota bacterium]